MIRDASAACKIVMALAELRGDNSRREIRERLGEAGEITISRQKFDQWCDGQASFPNDFAEIMTRAYDLTNEEQIRLALALSFTQRTRRLRV